MKAADIKCPHENCGKALADPPPEYDFTPGEHTEIKARSVWCPAGHRAVVSSVRKQGRVEFQVWPAPQAGGSR